MSTAIDLSNVTVVRDGNTLLDQVSWTVREGERWIVLGPNGAGKTTLMQVAGAAMHPSKGVASVLGQELGTVDVQELRTRIGHSSTKVADQIPPRERAADVVLSASYAVTGRWQEQYDDEDLERRDQIMLELGLDKLKDRTFGTLSEGERKRILIARALMTDPEMLILDEPAAGLDLGAREDLVESLEMVSSDPQAPVLVMVTHHVEEIPAGFTHLALMRGGRITAQGPIATTLTAENLSTTFGARFELTRDAGRFSARRAAYVHRRP